MRRHRRHSFGSAIYWMQGHQITLERYLQRFYPIFDWPMIKSFFYDNPLQGERIIKDFAMTNENKMKKVIDMFTDGKSKIVYIVGGRGGGKTCTAFMIAETIYMIKGYKIYYVGDGINTQALPSWCISISNIQDIPDGSFAIIDESAIQFNARDFSQQGNKDLSKLLVIARHKDLSLIFLTQHQDLADTNLTRLKDMVIWKQSNDYNLGEKGSHRSKEYQFWKKVRNMMAPRSKEECLFEYPQLRQFIHFTHGLPDCWSDELSKSWKGRTFKRVPTEESKKDFDEISAMINKNR